MATGITREVLQRVPIDELPGWEHRLVKLVFPPGVDGTLHSHPVPGIGYVVSGQHISQWEGSEPEYYKTGDSFVDRALERHVRTENSGDGPLEIILSYVIKADEANITPLKN